MTSQLFRPLEISQNVFRSNFTIFLSIFEMNIRATYTGPCVLKFFASKIGVENWFIVHEWVEPRNKYVLWWREWLNSNVGLYTEKIFDPHCVPEKNYDSSCLLVDRTLQSVKSAFTTCSSGKTFILSSSISKISDVKASSSRITESNLEALESKKSILCAPKSPVLWMQCGIGYALEYVKMLPSEHLWADFPLGYENGTGLGIGLEKDGVVVVTAILFSTKAITSCSCEYFLSVVRLRDA